MSNKAISVYAEALKRQQEEEGQQLPTPKKTAPEITRKPTQVHAPSRDNRRETRRENPRRKPRSLPTRDEIQEFSFSLRDELKVKVRGHIAAAGASRPGCAGRQAFLPCSLPSALLAPLDPAAGFACARFCYLTSPPAIWYAEVTYGQPYVEMPRRNDAQPRMPDQPHDEKPETEVPRVKLTARVTLDAYDAITEIQRRYRRRTGRALRLWEVLDAAIVAYAKRQGIKVGE